MQGKKIGFTEFARLLLENYIKDKKDSNSWLNQITKELAETALERKEYKEIRERRKMRGREVIYADKNMGERLASVDAMRISKEEKDTMKAEIIEEQKRATGIVKKILYGKRQTLTSKSTGLDSSKLRLAIVLKKCKETCSTPNACKNCFKYEQMKKSII